MERYFNIGGPCSPERHYMLPALARLPQVVSLIGKEQYFAVHAQRQCGKTTAFQALADEINAKGERVAFYCSVEAVQMYAEPDKGVSEIVGQIRMNVGFHPELFGETAKADLLAALQGVEPSARITEALNWLSMRVKKPLVVFFDEVDCLAEATLVSFLRQLRNGRISCKLPGTFPTSIALIGMRDIRDYKAKIRPDSETMGSASPFNVITEAMTLRVFTAEEVSALYAQHTAATGQVFEPEAVRLAVEFSGGQPYLVNALARWCVEKIHGERYGETITAADMREAKEKIIRERPGYLNSIWKRSRLLCVDLLVEAIETGRHDTVPFETYRSAEGFGIVKKLDGQLAYCNDIVKNALATYRSSKW